MPAATTSARIGERACQRDGADQAAAESSAYDVGEARGADERECAPGGADHDSEPRIATFVPNSVVSGAMRRREQAHPDRVRPPPVSTRGNRLGVGDHEEEEDENLRRRDEEPPELRPSDRADVPRRRHLVPAQGEHADSRCERQPEPDGDPDEVQPPEDEEAPDHDQHERDDERGGERAPPEGERVGALGAEQEEAEHEAEVRRVENVPPSNPDQVLRKQGDR